VYEPDVTVPIVSLASISDQMITAANSYSATGSQVSRLFSLRFPEGVCTTLSTARFPGSYSALFRGQFLEPAVGAAMNYPEWIAISPLHPSITISGATLTFSLNANRQLCATPSGIKSSQSMTFEGQMSLSGLTRAPSHDYGPIDAVSVAAPSFTLNGGTALTAQSGTGGTVAMAGSPALTGNPTAPTQRAGDNSTRLATTAYVATALSSAYPRQIAGSGSGYRNLSVRGPLASPVTVVSSIPASALYNLNVSIVCTSPGSGSGSLMGTLTYTLANGVAATASTSAAVCASPGSSQGVLELSSQSLQSGSTVRYTTSDTGTDTYDVRISVTQLGSM
jgi:hypothetical protein